MRDSLALLPGSDEEVAAIIHLFSGLPGYGEEATLEHFREKADKYRVLHLATHGKADDRMGDSAYLAFAAHGRQGCFDKLYAYEIYNLSLNADLVNLSAT